MGTNLTGLWYQGNDPKYGMHIEHALGGDGFTVTPVTPWDWSAGAGSVKTSKLVLFSLPQGDPVPFSFTLADANQKMTLGTDPGVTFFKQESACPCVGMSVQAAADALRCLCGLIPGETSNLIDNKEELMKVLTEGYVPSDDSLLCKVPWSSKGSKKGPQPSHDEMKEEEATNDTNLSGDTYDASPLGCKDAVLLTIADVLLLGAQIFGISIQFNARVLATQLKAGYKGVDGLSDAEILAYRDQMKVLAVAQTELEKAEGIAKCFAVIARLKAAVSIFVQMMKDEYTHWWQWVRTAAVLLLHVTVMLASDGYALIASVALAANQIFFM